MGLRAYFDASTRATGVFCVAGYVFAKPQVKKFDKEWSSLFSAYGGCHMRELAARNGRFRSIDDAEHLRLMQGAVRIINRRVSYGVVISCSLHEIDALLPKWIIGFQHAYPVCCHLVMQRLGTYLADNDRREPVAYFFEAGDEYDGVARAFIERAAAVPEVKAEYLHESHAFVGKEDAVALQAADFLAWEWAKYMDETIAQRKRQMRRSLMALMTKNGLFDKRYFGHHITGAPLARFCQQVHALGLLQREEERRG